MHSLECYLSDGHTLAKDAVAYVTLRCQQLFWGISRLLGATASFVSACSSQSALTWLWWWISHGLLLRHDSVSVGHQTNVNLLAGAAGDLFDTH